MRKVEQTGEFLIMVSEGAYEKPRLQTGTEIEGKSAQSIIDGKKIVDFYKTSGIKLVMATEGDEPLPILPR
ncbi:MAG TPA: hypothetical protein VLX29_02485 [Nitrospirota bacterium]|nr:hypothetical protein [Nitrospirota bacterium]